MNNPAILIDPVKDATCPKCGAILDVEGLPAFALVQCVTCEAEFQVPSQFGTFRLLQLLGAGGMGGVYRARDEALNREVAIKVMLKSLGDDPQFVTTFQREAQAAARLNHPNIAQIYSFGQEKGQPYIVMELVSGGSLDRMMAVQGPMDPARVLHIGMQIAEGLKEAADAGLVHGDVKPENILFDLEQNAKLVDFGLSAMACGPNSDVWGTPYYIAPEKVRRQKSDFRSDIYSLGGTLYHAITGVPPFDGEDATAVVKARFDGPAKPMRELRAEVPEEVELLISRMLEMEQQKRFPTYGSLLGDMRRYLAKAGPIKAEKKSKKIVIKGKRGAFGKSDTGNKNSLTTGIVGDLPPGMVPVSDLEEVMESDDMARKRGLKTILVLLSVILLLGGLIASGVYGYKYNREKKRHEAELAQIQKSQTSATSAVNKAVEISHATLKNLQGNAAEADAIATTAANEVVAVLGEAVRAVMVPKFEEAALVIAATNVVAQAGATNVVAEAAATNVVAEVAATNVVEGGGQLAEKAEENSDVHPIVNIVRGMFLDAYAVRAAVILASNIVQEVDIVAQEALAVVPMEKAATEALVQKANGLVEKVRNMVQNRQIGEAARKVVQLKRTLESVKTDVASLIELKRQEAAAQEQKMKADAEAEAQKAKQEASARKIAEEIARVQEIELSNVALLRQLQFREVLRVLQELAEGVETSEARNAVGLARERVNRIKEFHDYLVKNVVGFKSARGWSIDSADNKNISVAGRKILWTEVYVNRMDIVGELINGLVFDEQAVKGMRLRERTHLMTNAALCLNLFYKEVASAQERAKKLATDAARQFDVDADTIKQLLPEFF